MIAAAVCFAVALALQATHALQRWDYLLQETYSGWSRHEQPSDLVVIGIDARSLAELNDWPWPRRNHARLLDVLRDAAPRRVFFDIDFSSTSSAVDDEAMASAIARWERTRMVLPVFVQADPASPGELIVSRPLPALASNATLASVNLVADGDAMVRRIQRAWPVDGAAMPSVFALLAGVPVAADAMRIDFSISPASFAYYSYVDVMQGRIPLEALRDKTILIGATALELGDMQPVPGHHALPGVVIHALATQTARGEQLRDTPLLLSILLLAGWALLLAWGMNRLPWLAGLALAVVAAMAATGLGYGLFLMHLMFDAAPLLLVSVADFIAVTLCNLDAANLRSRLLARLANRRQVLFDSVFETAHDGILCVDQQGVILSANPAALKMLAGTAASVIAQPMQSFLPALAGAHPAAALDAMNGRILEREITTCERENVPVEISTVVAAHDEGRNFTLVLRDLRERRREEAYRRHLATHDALTGLPNRVRLVEELQARIAVPGGRSPAVLLLNLTRFKEVNDTLGHAVGDVVLKATARRLDAVISGCGMIARMDGDQFVALTDFASDRQELLPLARDLVTALRKPIVFEGVPIGIGVSIGVACFPLDGMDAAALIKNADIAMYEAKRLGEDLVFYDPAQDEHSLRRLALLGEMRAAMEADKLELYYQPQVSLATGKVVGVEALLRWHHPVHGFVSPGEIIPLIERTDMLRPLTDWTIGRALAQQQAWARQGVHVRMAVNLSARVLQDLKFPDRLAAMLATHPDTSELELEITESATMLYVDRALAVGRRIRELGVQLSVDDYGTGQSSLSYLRDLSVTSLKLDRTFIENLENRLDNQVIVESTLALAHALRLTTVAEGISSSWEMQHLRRLGYEVGQGYFFSPPLEPVSCLAWIRVNDRVCDESLARIPQRRAG